MAMLRGLWKQDLYDREMDLRSLPLEAKKCWVLIELFQFIMKDLVKPLIIEHSVLRPLFDRI